MGESSMIYLVIGGSASGKSEFAESICTVAGGQVAYVATMQPFGKDAQYRIARHLKLREGKGFLTVEQYTDIAKLRDHLGDRAQTLLIECMSNLCANEMFSPEGIGANAGEWIAAGVDTLSGYYRNIVIVTNEVFSDGVQYDSETMRYLEQLGKLNRLLAERADGVVEVFYGIPLILKDNSGWLQQMIAKD